MSVGLIAGGPNTLRPNRRGWRGRVLPVQFDPSLFAFWLTTTTGELGPTYDYSHREHYAVARGAVPDATGFTAGVGSYFDTPVTITDVAARLGEVTMFAVWRPDSAPCTAIGNFAGPSIPHVDIGRSTTSNRLVGTGIVKATDGSGVVTYPSTDNRVVDATNYPLATTPVTNLETMIYSLKVGQVPSLYRRRQGSTGLTKATVNTTPLIAVPSSTNTLKIGRDVLGSATGGQTGPCRVVASGVLDAWVDDNTAAALDAGLQTFLASLSTSIAT